MLQNNRPPYQLQSNRRQCLESTKDRAKINLKFIKDVCPDLKAPKLGCNRKDINNINYESEDYSDINKIDNIKRSKKYPYKKYRYKDFKRNKRRYSKREKYMRKNTFSK